MRTSLVLMLAVAALGSSAASAQRHLPRPSICSPMPTTRDPFYGVRATQADFRPFNRTRPVHVTGRYRLDMRRGHVSLVLARPPSGNSRLLPLRLRYVPGRGAGGGCVWFSASFPVHPVRQVQITDWRGRRINAPVRR